MIHGSLKPLLRRDQRIRPTDGTPDAAEINVIRTLNDDGGKRKKGHASPVPPLEAADRRLRRLRIIRDNVAHTAAKCNFNRGQITLRDADQIGNGAKNTAAPALLCLQHHLYVFAKSLIAFL